MLLKLLSGNSDNNFSFEDLEKVLLNLGFDKRNTGGYMLSLLNQILKRLYKHIA